MESWQHHYKRAERLLKAAEAETRVVEWKTALIDEALVHATLAKIGYEGPMKPIDPIELQDAQYD